MGVLQIGRMLPADSKHGVAGTRVESILKTPIKVATRFCMRAPALTPCDAGQTMPDLTIVARRLANS